MLWLYIWIMPNLCQLDPQTDYQPQVADGESSLQDGILQVRPFSAFTTITPQRNINAMTELQDG